MIFNFFKKMLTPQQFCAIVYPDHKWSRKMIDRYEEFTQAVSAAYKYILKIKAFYMSEFDLKAAHVTCLHTLSRRDDGYTPTEICEATGEDKATISKALAALTEKGYVTSVNDGFRKYKAKFFLTDAGKNVSRQIGTFMVEAVNSCGGNLSDADREVFYRAFRSIVESMAEFCDELEAKK